MCETVEIFKADVDYLFDRINKPISKGDSKIAYFLLQRT